MGNDSFTLEQSLWIRNAIADMLMDPCACVIYNSGYACLRCEQIRRAAQLFPIQHQQAADSVNRYMESNNGIQS